MSSQNKDELILALLRANFLAFKYQKYARKRTERFWNRLGEIAKEANIPDTIEEVSVWLEKQNPKQLKTLAEKINLVCDAFQASLKREKRKII